MAKKAQKGKPAKKAAQPAKKVVAKKPAKKVAPKKVVAKKPIKKAVAKKVAPKKIAKPVKKVAAKKAVAKKVVAKKVVKKVLAKKPVAKKVVAKKVAKPVKKVAAKKVVAKKVIAKKVVAKKVVAKPVKKVVAKPAPKKVAKPVVAKKEVKKAEVKKIVAPVAKPAVVAPVAKKTAPIVKKKQGNNFSIDDDSSRDEAPMVVEYKTPTIRKPLGPIPTPHINTDTRTRYNDSELKEFKELIVKKLTEAQKDYELLKSTLSHKDDHGTDDTSPTFKLLEDGSDVLSKEETAHLAGRQEKFIQNLQNALVRIENKTYGICRATGKLISKERLRSVPHATLAIEAKLDQHN
jgi:RNA polymerase-binding transcription factor DksA